MNKINPKVDWFFAKAGKWQKETETLRNIVLECDLAEKLKWGCPCYTNEDSNIVLIHVFKDYCALLFFKGVLLKDAKGILIQQTKNVQVARQLRFTSASEIVKMKATIKTYIKEAIAVEKSGVKPELKKTTEFVMPDEFKGKLDKNKALKKAFYELTPGRQRGYLLYFSSAKQTTTREARVEKSLKAILSGKGLED